MSEGHDEASGYAASLRQQATWIDESREGKGSVYERITMDDIDTDELRAAADYIQRCSERNGALVEALKFTTECLESYSFSRGIDPRTASPDSAIGKARAALAAVKGEPKA